MLTNANAENAEYDVVGPRGRVLSVALTLSSGVDCDGVDCLLAGVDCLLAGVDCLPITPDPTTG